MIAWAAHERILAGDVWGDAYNIEAVAQWPVDRAPMPTTMRDVQDERAAIIGDSIYGFRRNWPKL